jgi:ABC-type lipoprotein export system ATPase subunit
MESSQSTIPKIEEDWNKLSLASIHPEKSAIIVVGSLGSGKSTMLNSLMGLEKSGAFETSDATVGCTQSF